MSLLVSVALAGIQAAASDPAGDTAAGRTVALSPTDASALIADQARAAVRSAVEAGGLAQGETAEDVARAEFDADPALRAEFGSLATYSAWRRADLRARGLTDRHDLPVVQSPPAVGYAAAIEITERTWRDEFARSSALQTEFGAVETFLAYRLAEASGRIV